MTDVLPFLAVYGPLFWRLVALGAVVIVLVVIWCVRLAVARHHAKQALRVVCRTHGSIRGTLRGGEVTTVTLAATSGGAVASWRPESLWLETADREIELVGPVHVVTGSRHVGCRRWLPALPTEQTDAVIAAVPWVLTTTELQTALALRLAPGDEIEVRGLVEPRAGQAEVLSREAAIEWTARGDEAPLQLAAVTPVAARIPFGAARTLLVAIATFGLATVTHRAIGDHYLDACRPADAKGLDPTAPIELSNTHACVLAASVPNTHERGLDFLHSYLADHPYRDAVTVARLDALAAEVVPCDQRVTALFDDHRYERAIDEARRCNDRRHEHLSLVALGRYDEAAEVVVSPIVRNRGGLPNASTLIAAGRWREAAEEVRIEANYEEDDNTRMRHACLADWLSHLGGEREATARLRLLASEPTTTNARVCAGVLSEFEPERRAFWLRFDEKYPFVAPHLLAVAGGVYDSDPFDAPDAPLLQPEYAGFDAMALWLPWPDPTRSWERISAARWRAVKRTYDNDPDGALVMIREASQLAHAIADEEINDRLRSHPIEQTYLAIQLYTNTIVELELPDDPLEYRVRQLGRLIARSRIPIDNLALVHNDETNQAFRIARTGNGKKLAQLLSRHAYWNDADVIAMLPHITRDRDVLARALPYLRSGAWSADDSPVRNAIWAFSRRELFEAAGATAEAARWDAVYRRVDKVLSDRQKWTALVLLAN